MTSNERYVERPERTALVARQAPLGRGEASRAALIPIRKSPAWWELTQDERRSILEDRSRHIATGLELAARHGCHPLRGVASYGDVYKLTYVRGPSGILVMLAEELNKG